MANRAASPIASSEVLGILRYFTRPDGTQRIDIFQSYTWNSQYCLRHEPGNLPERVLLGRSPPFGVHGSTLDYCALSADYPALRHSGDGYRARRSIHRSKAPFIGISALW